jgi:monothiol glutaredoxin
MQNINERIEDLIKSHQTFLFMKGTPEKPRCGFSANTCGILSELGVTFNSFDILSDTDIRQGVKDYSNWPTYPQLYHKGELVGGNDILTELYNSGELAKILQ